MNIYFNFFENEFFFFDFNTYLITYIPLSLYMKKVILPFFHSL